MRICHIITSLVYGGAEMLLLNSCNLPDTNEYLIIYLKDKPFIKNRFDSKIEIINIPITKSVIKNIRKRLDGFKPNIVHTHLGHADFIGLWAAKNTKSKLFCTMHNIYFKYNLYDQIFFWGYRILFKIVKNVNVISISKSVKDHVENKLKVNPKRSFLIYNGIPSVPLKEKANNNFFNMLFVGRLSRQKNLSLLIRAIKELSTEIPKLQLDIIGAGPLESELKQMVEELSLITKVNFRGICKTPETYFSSADLFILPSIFEGFGLVIIEAFRSKCAVIASDIEGPKEIIAHGENGLLFENNNVKSLCENIKRLYENPKEREYIAENGFSEFDKKYRIEKYKQRLMSLYEEA